MGERYSLGYADQRCDRARYVELPEGQYKALEDWAYNSRHYGVIAPIVDFQITARLATHDTRRRNTFTPHGSPWGWEYAWAEWARRADLIADDELKDPALIVDLLEAPLARAGLATGHGLDLTFVPRHLTRSVTDRLVPILIAAEARLDTMNVMSRVPRTLDEVVGTSVYAPARRRTFAVFGID